jgi:two-component system response regulator NreC
MNVKRNTKLSARELQILRGIALGYTGADIAQQLAISKKTVETYRCRIYEKLNLHTRSQLVGYAIGNGVIVAPPGKDTILPRPDLQDRRSSHR